MNPFTYALVAASISGLAPYSRSKSKSCSNISIRYSMSALFDWLILLLRQVLQFKLPSTHPICQLIPPFLLFSVSPPNIDNQAETHERIIKSAVIQFNNKMHSSFKSKPISYSQIQNHPILSPHIGHDDTLIPDEHSAADQQKPNSGTLRGKGRVGGHAHALNPAQHKINDTLNKIQANPGQIQAPCQGSQRLTHGLKSYKDIKSSYCISRTNGSRENITMNSRSGSKKKNILLDEQYLNRIDSGYVQCTFTPKTNNGPTYKNFNDFVDFQTRFLSKKSEKIQKIKKQIIEKESSEATFTPLIDKKSRRMLESSSDYQMDSHGSLKKIDKKPAVHERLYHISHRKERGWQDSSFTPKILNKSKSLVRNEKVQNLLYSDALRRIDQQKMTQKQSRLPKYPPSASSSKKYRYNNKLVCKKIRAEFLQLIQTNEEQDAMQSISPILAVTILSQIFNVELDPNKNEQLCWFIVSCLVEDEAHSSANSAHPTGNVDTRRLWDFIKFIIVGVDGYEKGVSSFTQEEAQKIHDQLGYFYSMRLSKWPSKLEEAEDPESERQMELSQKTNQMAEAHRARKLEQITQFISDINLGCQASSMLATKCMEAGGKESQQRAIRLQDLFILDQIRKKTQLEAKKLRNDQEEMKKCTFKPALNENSLRKAQERGKPKTVTEIDEGKETTSKVIQQPQPKERGKKIVIKSKNNENRLSLCDENRAPKESDPTTCRNIKDVTKTLLRLNLARKVKDVEMASKQRGYQCKGSSNWLRQTQEQKKRVVEEVATFLGYRPNSNEKSAQRTNQLGDYHSCYPK